jgi:hypothetical protein
MSPMKSTRTQLHITDIHVCDDTLHVAALAAEGTTPTVFPKGGIDNDRDGVLYQDVGGERNKYSLIYKDIGCPHSENTDKHC